MEKSKNQKNKVRFVVVREFSGEKSMREVFEQLIERQTCEHFEDCLLYTSHYRVKDEVPWRVEGSRPIGSSVKRLAQGELMPASTRTGYYLTQNSQRCV